MVSLAVWGVTIACNHDRFASGDRRARNIGDAKAGPCFLPCRLPDRQGVLDALTQDQRLDAGQPDGSAIRPTIDSLVGALHDIHWGLLAVVGQIDLLNSQNVTGCVRGKGDQRAVLASGKMPEHNTGWRGFGDSAVAQIGRSRAGRDPFATGDNLGHGCLAVH